MTSPRSDFKSETMLFSELTAECTSQLESTKWPRTAVLRRETAAHGQQASKIYRLATWPQPGSHVSSKLYKLVFASGATSRAGISRSSTDLAEKLSACLRRSS